MRSFRLLLPMALLSIFACLSKANAQFMAAAQAEPPLGLTVCIFQSGDDQDSNRLLKTFEDLATGNSYFIAVVKASSLDDAQNCDVSVKFTYEKTQTKPATRTGRAEAFSTRSKKLLFRSEVEQGWGWSFARRLTADVHARLKNDSYLLQSLAAEKTAPKAREELPPAQPVQAKADKSDVDEPSLRMAEQPNDFAVVVGIEKYSNDLPDAQFAEHDASAVKAHLLALGTPERNIKFLTGSRATGTSLASYIEDWLPRNVKANSRVFFYFSGHGAPSESGQAYLVPWDGNPNFLEKSAYPLKKLYAQLGGLKAKQVIVALDSCFSGGGGRSVLAEGARPLVAKVDTSVDAGSKLVLFAAASSKEMTATLKEQEHGIFTYYFLKGLGGAAKDASGAVTARGLYEYLKPKVQDAASRQNRDQTPVLEGPAEGELARFTK